MRELDTLAHELREVARNIQGNLGRCSYRRKDVDEMQKVSDLLLEAADTIDGLRKQVAKCQIAELKADYDTSRYFELFGTPERAVRTLVEMCRESDGGSCAGCPFLGSDVDDCSDTDALLEWLRSDGEVIDEPDTIRNELMDGGLLRSDAE